MPTLTISLDHIDNNNCRAYFRAEETDGIYCYLQEGRDHYELYDCTSQGEPIAPIDQEAFYIYLSGEIESDGTPTGDAFAKWAETAFYEESDLSPTAAY
ncbi:hypothetical protein G6L37_05240 [Agrobacterium rubi]|nr:hypothetical protein [Agrobacterium rubi]NTF24761.1 hypothetical protein [Agrobacterium rubi]